MPQTIDPIKLKAAAEHLERVLQQYPDSEEVQSLLQALTPLLEDAKAGRVTEPAERIPCEYDFADGRYIPFKDPCRRCLHSIRYGNARRPERAAEETNHSHGRVEKVVARNCAMTSHAGLTSPEVREKYSSYTDDYRTFRTLGLSRELADEFLDTPEGENYWRYLAEANPDASSEQIDKHAIDHLRSGREFPRVQTIDEPLAKIVPCRRSGSPRSSMPPASTPRCASTKRG